MRVGVDGLLLAINDAALGLLGADEPSQVLGQLLTTWIAPTHQDAWRDFAATVESGASISVECDIKKDLSGSYRRVVFHGVPLMDHPDGVCSILLGARDSSAFHRLEVALQDKASPQTAIERAQLQQTLVKQSQLEQLLKQGKTHLVELRIRLDDAAAERDGLATELSELKNVHQQLIAERNWLEEALNASHHENVQELEKQLQAATTQRDQLALELSTLQTTHEQFVAEYAQFQSRLVERHELDLEEERQQVGVVQAQLEDVRTQLEDMRTERDGLAMQLAERETAQEQVVAALEAELRASTTRDMETEKARADQYVELQALGLTVRRLEPLAAAGRLAFDMAHELRSVMAHIEARVARLMENAPLESANRKEIEQLRGDAIHAESLARQIVSKSGRSKDGE